MNQLRNCGDAFCLLLVDSQFHPGTKAWRVVRVEEQKIEAQEVEEVA